MDNIVQINDKAQELISLATIEEIVANEHVHAGQKHAPIGVRVIPADHLQVIREFIPLATDLGPRIMRKLEAAFCAFVVLSAQAIGNQNERLSLLILKLPAQQHTAQLDRLVGGGMGLHITHHIQIKKNG